MKNKMSKLVALLAVSALACGTLVGCGSTATEVAPVEETVVEEAAPAEETASDLSGSIAMAGSTSMEKLATALSEVFMQKYPGITVTAEFTGSSAGIESLAAGSVDIGNSSRSLKDSEIPRHALLNSSTIL